MEPDKDQQFEKLRNLWMSGELEGLERKMDKFNIFSALKLDNTEIRHSNFLAWLMNPRESHDIGDYFLKEFLKNAIDDFICDKRIDVKPTDILDKRFYECDIRREYKNIDILIINPDTKLLCLIENKIWSTEHNEQLERYAKHVEKEFRDYKKLHIFLTPEKKTDKSLLERDTAFYIQMDYEQVVTAIEKTLKHRGHIMSDDVRVFVEHYKKMVERNIMNTVDKDVKDFCRALYRDHKEAIDLINKCTEDINDEIMSIIKEVVQEKASNTKFEKSTVYFIHEADDLNYGKDKNWLNGSIVGFYIGKNDTNAGFDFGMSVQFADKENISKRNKLITALEYQFGELRGKGDAWRWKPIAEIITFDEYCNIGCVKTRELINETIEDYTDKLQNILAQVVLL